MFYKKMWAFALCGLISSSCTPARRTQVFDAGVQSPAVSGVTAPVMVDIPAGEFFMGANEADVGFRANQGPRHKVNIEPFRMAAFEVTVMQFREFIESTGYQPNQTCVQWTKVEAPEDRDRNFLPGNWLNPGIPSGDFHPVLCVSWADAKEYVKWLSETLGRSFRLPSEAEWEYSARAGTTVVNIGFYDSSPCKYANVLDQSGSKALMRDFNVSKTFAECDDYADYISIVGMYKPNAFGLFDMIGNVDEFVADCEHPNYDGAPTDGSVWWSANCSSRASEMIVRRGGGYNIGPEGLGFAKRNHAGQRLAGAMHGFRIAEDIAVKGVGASAGQEALTGMNTLNCKNSESHFIRELCLVHSEERAKNWP